MQELDYSDGDTIPKPTWHKLFFKSGSPPSGEVLLSFAIVDGDFNFKKTLPKLALENEV